MGKALNMDMLKTFLEIEMEKDGVKQIASEKRLNSKLFNNLEITKGNYCAECFLNKKTLKISMILMIDIK